MDDLVIPQEVMESGKNVIHRRSSRMEDGSSKEEEIQPQMMTERQQLAFLLRETAKKDSLVKCAMCNDGILLCENCMKMYPTMEEQQM